MTPELPPRPEVDPADPLGPELALFDACYARHQALVPDQVANMELKRDHSLRVLAEARAITASLGPADGLDRAADPGQEREIHVAALYHDAGRFPQLVRWGTFDDKTSANHGTLGVRAIRACGLLDGARPGPARLVRVVVALHNRRLMPRGLPPRMDLALRVVRDADKLDILRVMLAQFRSGARNDVVTLGLARDEAAYTPTLLTRLLEGRQGVYEDMRFVNDFKLLLLSWASGLEFAASRRAFLERGYVRELTGALPDLPDFAGLCGRLEAALAATL